MSTTPMTPSQWLENLRAEGLEVEGYRSWQTHERDDETGKVFGPVNGNTIHHTAGRDSLALVYNGTSALPGPLCHTYIGKDGKAWMISAGRANHAGTFAANAHNAVLAESASHPYPDAAEPVDGNDHYYGLEAENLGDGVDVWPWKQYVAMVKWATATSRHQKWNQESTIGHKEGTRRKIDPKGPVRGPDGEIFQFTMGRFRADVRDALALPAGRWQGTAQEEDVALTQDDIKKIWYGDFIPAVEPPYNNDDWNDGNTEWTAKYALHAAVEASREAQARTRSIEAKLDALVVGGVDLDALAEKVADLLAARLAK